MSIVAVISEAAAALGASPAQVAIAWVLERLPRSIALVGLKRPAQLREALGALKLRLTDPWRTRLDDISALADAAGPTHARA